MKLDAFDYLLFFVIGLFGLLLHIAVKLGKINKKYDNVHWSEIIKIYFKREWPAVIVTLLAMILALFLLTEYLLEPGENTPVAELKIKYKIANFLRTIFAVVGYAAQSIVSAVFGGFEATMAKFAAAKGVTDEPEKP